MDDLPLLEAVPNFSVGRDVLIVDGIVDAARAGFERGAAVDGSRALVADVHRDRDHDRTVLTMVGRGEALAAGLEDLARACVTRIDLHAGHGAHPRVGVLDVLPIVALQDDDAGGAAAHALVRRIAGGIGGQLDVPVVRYGLDQEGAPIVDSARTGQVRRGGLATVAKRIAAGDLQLLAGPFEPHPTAGVTICGVRDVLVAFNVDLATDDLDAARAIAARIRESSEGDDALPGVRALGLWLDSRAITQVSTNVERHGECGPARVVESIVRIAAELGVEATTAELVGLAPDSALAPLRYACTRHGLALSTGPQPSLETAVARLGETPSGD
jgi:glutamate formiminotransferase